VVSGIVIGRPCKHLIRVPLASCPDHPEYSAYSFPDNRRVSSLEFSLTRYLSISTTLKQFQLLYAPSSFAIEAPSWRPIIYLNLVRSIRRILEVITVAESEYSDHGSDRPTSPSSIGTPERGRGPSLNLGVTDEELAAFASIRSSLSPLLDLEDRLISLLSDPDEESGEATRLNPAAFHTAGSRRRLGSSQGRVADRGMPGSQKETK
jgi:hypothetical protein